MKNVIMEQTELDIKKLSPIRTPEQIEKMREAGRISAETLNLLGEQIKPGITTKELDILALKYIQQYGAELDREDLEGYNYGEDQAVFFTLNNIVARGMATDIPLKAGDILGIDLSLKKEGWCGDTQKMWIVGGDTSSLARRLLSVAYDCMWVGINAVKPGVHIGSIANKVQKYVESHSFNMVKIEGLTGHSIGQRHCEGLLIPFYGQPNTGHILEEGMVITIEPFICAGSGEAQLLPTELRSVKTKDNTLAAFWEHVIVVTKGGCEVLDLRPGESG